MTHNIHLAKRLIKLAKSLVAVELIGNAYYRIMDEQNKQISINFSIDSKDRDELLGWFDAMLSRPTEIIEIGKKYGFNDMPDTMDINNTGMFLSICLKGNEESDIDGLITQLKSKYHCNEVR